MLTMLRRGALMLAAAALVLMTTREASACSCISPGPPCQEVWRTNAVFLGRVLSIADAPARPTPAFLSNKRVRVAITESFRGVPVETKEVDVYTGNGGGDCGYTFVVGGDYLIYAESPQDGLGFRTSICSRTQPVAKAQADLAYLRGAFQRPATLGHLTGQVQRWEQYDPPGSPRPPVAGLTIVAHGGGKDYSGRTHDDGTFDIEVPPGVYTLAPELTGPVYADVFYSDHLANVGTLGAELLDARGCTSVNVAVHADGVVDGHVVDRTGAPVPALSLDLVPVDRFGGYSSDFTARTTTDGTFEMHHVPPGRYYLGFNIRRDFNRTFPLPTILYPGVPATSEARVIEVGAGARLSLDPFVVPESMPLVHLTGVVRDADGNTVAGAKVYMKSASTSQATLLGDPAISDADGRFKVTLVEGAQYRILAELATMTNGTRRLSTSPETPFVAVKNAAPLVLILK